MPGRPRKRWTALIYMVADDPQGGELLDEQAVREMDQITKAALSVSSDQPHVALQIDFRTLPGVWRRVIGESTFVRPEGNAADPATLYGFFEWAVRECPAEHYLLIFWGHSRGQFGLFGDPDPFEYTAQTLTLDELREALMAAKRSLGKAVDVIAFKDCFMATLETAYELNGLANYLLASGDMVPVVGWPYDDIFEALARNSRPKSQRGEPGLDVALQILEALRTHYSKPANTAPFDEVPYSLLSTRGADAVVKKLGDLVGTGSSQRIGTGEAALRQRLEAAASSSGDPALVDLNALVDGVSKKPDADANEDAAAARDSKATAAGYQALKRTLGNAEPIGPARQQEQAAPAEQLVIEHTGKTSGGVSVFVYPSTPKGQRESRLTRLADEKAYRRLAISTDTKWADVALQSMPIQPARPGPDVAAAIAAFEQMQRLGLGMAPGSAASANGYLQRLARLSRNGDLSEAQMAQAAEFATIAELAARLAGFAAGKGADGFGGKGADGFGGKGADGFGGKGADGFGGKGADGFGGKGADGFVG